MTVKLVLTFDTIARQKYELKAAIEEKAAEIAAQLDATAFCGIEIEDWGDH